MLPEVYLDITWDLPGYYLDAIQLMLPAYYLEFTYVLPGYLICIIRTYLNFTYDLPGYYLLPLWRCCIIRVSFG